MFNRRKNQIKPFQIDTLIGAGTRINGDVQFKGGLHLDGTIVGNVIAEAATNAKLSVSDSGTVQGSINVATVVLNGLVEGDVVAQTRIDVGSTARVNGNVYYGLIEMAMGAQINGKLIHQSVSKTGETKAAEPAAVVVEIGSTAKTKLG